jgi:LysR family transcriptional regulator, mexEF-oprN operon transcriptional activator
MDRTFVARLQSSKSIESMIDINESDFRRLDLNLLLVFSALMRERSVTRAAARLFVGQPALSASLARLREFSKDELFVRSAQGMEPTALAVHWAQELKPLLEGLDQVLLKRSAFDPAAAEHTSRIGMVDSLEISLLPHLLVRLRRAAPGVRVVVRPVDRTSVAALLDEGGASLAVSTLPEAASRHRTQTLFTDRFLCLYDPKRLRAKSPLSLKDYLAHPHLLTSFAGDLQGRADEVLAERGLARRVVLSTSRFSVLPFLLAAEPTIVTLPASVAHACAKPFGLAISAAPLDLGTFDLQMVWHARSDRDPAQAWLRDQVVQAAQAMAGLSRPARRPRAPARSRTARSRPRFSAA